MGPPANHFYAWAVAQHKFHSTVTSDTLLLNLFVIYILSYILLLQHHSLEFYPLQWQLLVWVAKNKIICYYPYLVFFSPCFLTLLSFIFFFLYHLLPLNILIVKYLSNAVPRASATFQNQKATLTELFCEWEMRGETFRICKSQF